MKWIEVYLQEVGRRLPEKNREDILLEIRSTIEDMMPEDPTEEDIKSVLEEMGDPAQLAEGYREKPKHLIGPRYYDTYVSLIKMIIPIAITISLITLAAENILGSVQEGGLFSVIFSVLAEGIWRCLSVGMQVFFWVTLIFALIERVDLDLEDEPPGAPRQSWTPDDLKKKAHAPIKRTIPRWEIYAGLLWTAVWSTIYFHADQLIGIYENQSEGLTFIAPAMDQGVLMSFWPAVVLIIGLEIVLALYKLLKNEWTKGVLGFNIVLEVLSVCVFIWVITAERLFHPAFLQYIADLFNLNPGDVEAGLVWRIAVIFIIISIWNIIDGILKYRKGLKRPKWNPEFNKL